MSKLFWVVRFLSVRKLEDLFKLDLNILRCFVDIYWGAIARYPGDLDAFFVKLEVVTGK